MNSLYVFGCSYTAPYNLSNRLDKSSLTNYDKYYYYRHENFPLTWPELLAKKLNLQLHNHGKEGQGTEFVFESFCKASANILKNDYVVYEVPYIERFRIQSLEEIEWIDCSSETDIPTCPKNVSEHIAVQRTSLLYKIEILNHLKLIEAYSNSKGFKLYIWFADPNFHKLINFNDSKYLLNDTLIKRDDHTVFNPVFERGGLRIYEETNNEIDDMHFGESAHQIMAELFHEHILKNEQQ